LNDKRYPYKGYESKGSSSLGPDNAAYTTGDEGVYWGAAFRLESLLDEAWVEESCCYASPAVARTTACCVQVPQSVFYSAWPKAQVAAGSPCRPRLGFRATVLLIYRINSLHAFLFLSDILAAHRHVNRS
jgi:hypothetical protein